MLKTIGKIENSAGLYALLLHKHGLDAGFSL